MYERSARCPINACENFLYGFKGACGASRAGLPAAPGAGPPSPARRIGAAAHHTRLGW